MSLSRVLPAILLLGGGGVALKGGGEVGRELVDTVKTVMTRYELSEAARHLELDITLGNTPPRSTAQLAKWLTDNHHGRFARDPSLDLWHNPYRFKRGPRGRFALVSVGANAARDHCVDANLNTDRRRLNRQVKRATEVSSGDSPSAAARTVAADDDICAWVRPNDTRSAGGDSDRARNRDSPYRQIQHDQ